MRKCPNCGNIELYWRPLRWDPDEDYIQLGNFPQAKEWPLNKVQDLGDGFVYWRKRTRKGHEEFVSRLAKEEWEARGHRKRGRGTFYESRKTVVDLEISSSNQKLIIGKDHEGKHRLKVNEVPESPTTITAYKPEDKE